MAAWNIHVVTAKGGSPIAGAAVAVAVRLGRREGCVLRAQTDARGRCRVECDLDDGVACSVTVMASAPGYRAMRQGVSDFGERPVVARLRPGPTVRGRVSNSQGGVVVGAVVDLRGSGLGSDEVEQYGVTRWPPPARTDGDGRYELAWLSAGSQRLPEGDELVLSIQHPDFAAWERRGVQSLIPQSGAVDFDAVLSPCGASRSVGAAVEPPEIEPPEIEPEERALLRLLIRCGAWRRRAATGVVWLTLVDGPRFSFAVPVEADGRTAERRVPLGTYRAQVMVPGAATRHAKVRIDRDGAVPSVFRVARGRRVVGRVRDGKGAPVVGCFVQFANVRARVTPEGEATTDAAGRFSLSGVRGLCWFTLIAPGSALANRVRWIPSWVPWRRRLDVTMPSGCVVRGTVADPRGRPGAGVFVQLHSRGGTVQPACGYSGWTGADGCFELRNLPSGPARLTALGQEKRLRCRVDRAVEVAIQMP
ncbi:MAG: carboxypeptidase-like regulatory domain-containing protein [Planctomycetota bacterium]